MILITPIIFFDKKSLLYLKKNLCKILWCQRSLFECHVLCRFCKMFLIFVNTYVVKFSRLNLFMYMPCKHEQNYWTSFGSMIFLMLYVLALWLSNSSFVYAQNVNVKVTARFELQATNTRLDHQTLTPMSKSSASDRFTPRLNKV